MARPRKKPTTFPHYILLRDAAKQYHLSADFLTRLVNDGKIPAVKVNGDLAVEGEKLNVITKKIEIEVTLRQKYSHLRGIPITLVEAEKKYKIRRTSGYADEWLEVWLHRPCLYRAGEQASANLREDCLAFADK